MQNQSSISTTTRNIDDFYSPDFIWNSSRLKRKRTIHGMGNLHIWEGTINAGKYIQVLKQYCICCHPDNVFLRNIPAYSRKNNTKPYYACVTTMWFHSKRLWELDWPPCSPDLHYAL